MFSPCFPLSSSLCSHLLIIAIVLILLHYTYEEEGNREFNILKRFLYDLFNIFTGTTKQLHKIYEEINKLCDCQHKDSIPFLDIILSIENWQIQIDLYTKPTDRNQYLLPSSCHPKTTTKAIPYSLSLRIIGICTKPEARDQRLKELEELLRPNI